MCYCGCDTQISKLHLIGYLCIRFYHQFQTNTRHLSRINPRLGSVWLRGYPQVTGGSHWKNSLHLPFVVPSPTWLGRLGFDEMGGGFGTGDKEEVREGQRGCVGRERATRASMSHILVWENMKILPSLRLLFLAHYYAYLVEKSSHFHGCSKCWRMTKRWFGLLGMWKIPSQILFKVLIQVMEEPKVRLSITEPKLKTEPQNT
jgi:hypothetical protein